MAQWDNRALLTRVVVSNPAGQLFIWKCFSSSYKNSLSAFKSSSQIPRQSFRAQTARLLTPAFGPLDMLYFHPTLFLKDERHRQILHDCFWRQIEDSLLVLKKGSCEHTTNDLPTFSPQKRNLEIGPSERLLPVFETKNRILKNGSSERALLQNYPNECNHSLMMHGIKYVYSFFYLDNHFTPRKFLST